MLTFTTLCVYFIATNVVAVTILITYYKWIFRYWHTKKVPFVKPKIPFGNVTAAIFGKQHIGLTIKNLYHKMKKKGWKHGGIFIVNSPVYIPLTLDSMKNILAKDFSHFTDRDLYCNEKDDPLSGHLINLPGTKWRKLRTKLTSAFTSGKMRMMFQTLADCQFHLLKKMDEERKKEAINIKEILASFTTDIIGSCAFGLNCKSFEEENAPFRVFGRKVFDESMAQRLRRAFCFSFPGLAAFLKIRGAQKDVAKFFMGIVEDTVKKREREKLVRNDFLQLLLDMKKSDDSLTMEEIAAQCFVFFVAGFETSSTLMTFALYELAKNQKMQQKARDEIERVFVKYGGKITYDAVHEMKYLQQVINETLRLYPPVPVTIRKCVEDYKVPSEDFTIEKGTRVLIPILGIHYDEEYYPDPEKFDPERFSEKNKSSRHAYAHLPYGEGPRICIGKRFGLVQAKVGLSCLIKKYKLTVNRKTKEPLEMDLKSFLLSVKGDVWLNAENNSC